MCRQGKPEAIVTDKLKSYGAAMWDLNLADTRHEKDGRWLINRAESSHPLPGNGLRANHERVPFRRRERAMPRFRRMRSLQKFAAVHGSVYDCFNQERHLNSRSNIRYAAPRIKESRTRCLVVDCLQSMRRAALNERRQLFTA